MLSDNISVESGGEDLLSGQGKIFVTAENSEKAWIGHTGKLNLKPFSSVTFRIHFTKTAPEKFSFKCYAKDSQWRWFETSLKQAEKKDEIWVKLDISDESMEWIPQSHLKSWDSSCAEEIRELGIIMYFHPPYSGSLHIDSFSFEERTETDIVLYNFNMNGESVKRYEKLEISFNSSFIPENPFNPGEFRIEGEFVSSSGVTSKVPAFHYHEYLRYLEDEGENLFPAGRNKWKMRYTPREEGLHSFTLNVYVNGRKEKELNGGEFIVKPSDRKGFIGWDEKDPLYLSFGDGTFFYPIGHTLRSPDDMRTPYRYEFVPPSNEGTYAYDRYFKRMSENGQNYARIWMSAWWAGIEWNPDYAPHYKGLGRYSTKNAWRLDYILEAAEKYGIYVDLTLINHGQFGRPDAEWLDNPYNIINGGMLKTADRFFTNRDAMDFFKRRLEYIISRWGFSTNIVFWELWNEVDLTMNYNSLNVKNWHREMHSHIRKADPYKHLITTHFCRRDADPALWAIPEVEIIAGNAYSDEMVSSVIDFFTTRKLFEKPMIINEFGRGRNRKMLENNLHAGIWSSSMTPMTGSALFWWWPFIDHFDLYFHYKALSEFWKNEDRRGKDLQLSGSSVKGGNQTEIMGIQNSEEGFFWVYTKNVFNSREPSTVSSIQNDITVAAENFDPGTYTIEFWDTYKGAIVEKKVLQINGNTAEISLPVFTNDIALKIKKQ